MPILKGRSTTKEFDADIFFRGKEVSNPRQGFRVGIQLNFQIGGGRMVFQELPQFTDDHTCG